MQDQSFLKDSYLDRLLQQPISELDKKELRPFIEIIQSNKKEGKTLNLLFYDKKSKAVGVLAGIWSKVAAHYFDLKVDTTIAALQDAYKRKELVSSLETIGFKTEPLEVSNGCETGFKLIFTPNKDPLEIYPKKIEDAKLPSKDLILLIGGAELPADLAKEVKSENVLSLDWLTESKEEMDFDGLNLQIASKMFFVFSNLLGR